MDYHIGIGDEELPVTELCLILNNALENAVEASLTMPEGERIIKVQATVRQNQFLLRVSNRFEGCLTAAGGLPVSTKEGKDTVTVFPISDRRSAGAARWSTALGTVSLCWM